MHGEFWRLEPIESTIFLDRDPQAGREREKYVCPVDPAHQFSGKRLGDLHLVFPSISPQDFMWTWRLDCLIQDNVLLQFRSMGFTGFEAKPVHLRLQQADKVFDPKLWEIQVTGWAGMALPESGIKRIERCDACGRQVYTPFTNPEFLVDKKQWDGSDFFIVWPMSRFFITERVASVIRDQGLTGTDVIPVEEMIFPKHHVKYLGPLPLRFRFPEQRARELGQPLGIY